MNKKLKPFPFKIGADPEFNIVLGDQRLNAERLIELAFPKEEDRTSKEGEIGVDGNAATAELRPTPSNRIETFVNNIAFLIQKIGTKLPLMTFTTLSYKAPIGGHIHLDVPKGKNNNSAFSSMARRILSAMYIPVTLGDDKVSIQVRNNRNYGKIDDWHDETPGDKDTYEFRMPAAEWLTTPKLAASTLAYVATIYNEIVHHPETFKEKKAQNIIYKNDAQGELLAKLAMSDFQVLTLAIAKNVKELVRTFEFYPFYEKEIEYILNPKLVLEDKHKYNFDMMKGWGLDKKKKISKRDILSQKKADDLYLESNLECLREFIEIHVNKDRNVSAFEDELIKRIIAYSWEPKKDWCIFGLRKGFEEILIFDTKDCVYTGTSLIKTNTDKSLINDLMHKIQGKFGSTIQLDENTRFIGIPLKQRIKLQFKPFISAIYDIEINKLKPIHVTELGTAGKEESNGISNIIKKEIEPESPDELIDRDRDTNQSHFNDANAQVENIQKNSSEEEITANEEFDEMIEETGNTICQHCDRPIGNCICRCERCDSRIQNRDCDCTCPSCDSRIVDCHCGNCECGHPTYNCHCDINEEPEEEEN